MRKHLKCNDQNKYTKVKRSESVDYKLKVCTAVHFCWNAFASRTAESSMPLRIPSVKGLEIQFVVPKADCKQSGTTSHRLCQGDDGFFVYNIKKCKSGIAY